MSNASARSMSLRFTGRPPQFFLELLIPCSSLLECACATHRLVWLQVRTPREILFPDGPSPAFSLNRQSHYARSCNELTLAAKIILDRSPVRARGSFLRIRRGPRARSAGAPLAALRGSPPHVSVQSRKTAQCLLVIRCFGSSAPQKPTLS